MNAIQFKTSRSVHRRQWARDLQARVITIWDDARKRGLTHDQILTGRQTEIFESPHWGQLSHRERAEINAWFHACSEMAQRRDLVWRLGPKSGPLPEDVQGQWGEGSPFPPLARTPGALYGAHFWRGTDRPFNAYTCTNAPRRDRRVK
jgi:hypothetical protein